MELPIKQCSEKTSRRQQYSRHIFGIFMMVRLSKRCTANLVSLSCARQRTRVLGERSVEGCASDDWLAILLLVALSIRL